MKILFYFFFLTSLFSCQNTTNNIDTSPKDRTDSLSNSNLEAIKTPITTPIKTVTFSTMPLLATCINELPFYSGELTLGAAAEQLALRADTLYFLNEEEDGDYSYYYELENFSQQQATFRGGWYGTSGQQDWEATYQLLNDDKEAPIVLLATQSKESIGGYQETIEFNYDELEELIKEGNTSIDKDNLHTIAQRMANMPRNTTNLDGSYNTHELKFWVWQKQAGQWKNITSEVFQPEMYTKLEAAFPFLVQDKVADALIPGFFLEEKIYSQEGLIKNKANWQHWFGVNDLSTTSFELAIDNKAIQFVVSENKTLDWDWNGTVFTLNKLPEPITFDEEPCPLMDYNSDKMYTFTGAINSIPIQMEASFKDGKIKGSYWYINTPKSKFLVEGDFEASTEVMLDFYRMKNKEEREWFYAYFADCQFKGSWQHQETMATEQFTLKLVQK